MELGEEQQSGGSYDGLILTISEAFYKEDHYCRDCESGFRLIIRSTCK